MKPRLAGALVGLWVLLALAAAGCGKKSGDNGIATAGGPNAKPSATVSVAADPRERQRQFNKCMSDEGVPVQEIDEGDGRTGIVIGSEEGSGVDREKVAKAMEKCKIYTPGGGDFKPDAAAMEGMRKY